MPDTGVIEPQKRKGRADRAGGRGMRAGGHCEKMGPVKTRRYETAGGHRADGRLPPAGA